MLETATELFEPAALPDPLDWFCENIQTEEGDPYDHFRFPHLGSPGGPCDALANPAVPKITLQFAVRLGKTFFAQCASLYYAANIPCPQMVVSSTEDLCTAIMLRKYELLERCNALRGQLRPPQRRRQHTIDLDHAKIYSGWARSPSTIADKSVKFGHGNEVPKWQAFATSKEGDPVRLFFDRGNEFPITKWIMEGTPTVKGRCRIERLLHASTNCREYVPCPSCGKYQRLVIGDRESTHGLKWDKLPTGKSDPELARRTAVYVCEHCEHGIDEHERPEMLRNGVWVPEGAVIDHEGAHRAAKDGTRLEGPWTNAKWLRKKPAPVDREDAGYQLSALYSQVKSWGEIAKAFLATKDSPQELRAFMNQWNAETWELTNRQQTWEELGERMIQPVEQLVVPAELSFLTAGIDKQLDHYVYVVTAWGPDRTCHIVHYDIAEDEDSLWGAIERFYQHADGGEPVAIRMGFMDSGYRPQGVYEFCSMAHANGREIYPCRGSTNPRRIAYEEVVLGKRTSMPGALLIHVDTITTQDWMDTRLHRLRPPDPGSLGLFDGSLDQHRDFLEQLLNDAPDWGLDKSNNPVESWNRIDTTIPNDYRDALRYAYAAMLKASRGGAIPSRPSMTATPRARKRARLTRPDGRPWI